MWCRTKILKFCYQILIATNRVQEKQSTVFKFWLEFSDTYALRRFRIINLYEIQRDVFIPQILRCALHISAKLRCPAGILDYNSNWFVIMVSSCDNITQFGKRVSIAEDLYDVTTPF